MLTLKTFKQGLHVTNNPPNILDPSLSQVEEKRSSFCLRQFFFQIPTTGKRLNHSTESYLCLQPFGVSPVHVLYLSLKKKTCFLQFHYVHASKQNIISAYDTVCILIFN